MTDLWTINRVLTLFGGIVLLCVVEFEAGIEKIRAGIEETWKHRHVYRCKPDLTMVLHEKPLKRHSFTVEKLAISSRVEGAAHRDTDSPYLHYLGYATDRTASHVTGPALHCSRDYTHPWPAQRTAVTPPPPPTFHTTLPIAVSDTRFMAVGGSAHVMSTPKESSRKRRRSCSSSTPPSSDESAYSGERTEDNMSTSSDVGKLSPASSTSASSDGDGEEAGGKRATIVDGYGEEAGCKRKKARTAFSGEQLRQLEGRYKAQKYLTASDRANLARLLKLKDQQVKTWFQNRRMKEKRQHRDDEHTPGFCLPTGGVDIAQLAALGICPPPYGYQLASSIHGSHQPPGATSAISPNLASPHSPSGAYHTMASLRPSTDLCPAIQRPIPSTLALPDFQTTVPYTEPRPSLLSPPSQTYLNKASFVIDSLASNVTLAAPVTIAGTAAGPANYSPNYSRAPSSYMPFIGQHY